jgi:hypothetical protein
MDNDMSRYLVNRNVDGRMGETQKKRKKYDSTLSCRFGVVECLG